MQKIMDFLESKLMPIGIKLGENKYLKAINQGFMFIMPLTIFGSLFSLAANFPVTAWTNWLAETGLSTWFGLPSKLTIDLISLYTVVSLGYVFTKNEGHNAFAGALTSLMSFIMLTPLLNVTNADGATVTGLAFDWFGAKGLFVAMFVGCLVPTLYIFIINKGWTIKLPAGVPPMVSNSFSSLIPMCIVGVLSIVFAYLFHLTSFGSIHQLIYTYVSMPLQAVGGSFWGMIVFTLALHIFWFFGLHGGNITNSIANPILLPLALENLAAYEAGGVPTHIYSTAFKNTYQFGGAGMTISLCILMIFVAKSQQYKSLGKLALPANIFYINEPVTFGTPLVLNTTLVIPFILAPLVVQVLAYFLTSVGILPVLIGYQIPWTMPPIVSGFIQGGLPVALYQVFSIFLVCAIYYPFFKILDKQAYTKEQQSIEEK